MFHHNSVILLVFYFTISLCFTFVGHRCAKKHKLDTKKNMAQRPQACFLRSSERGKGIDIKKRKGLIGSGFELFVWWAAKMVASF